MSKGTYAGVRLKYPDTVYARAKYFDIPNLIDPKDMHVTLLYSRKYLPDYVPNKSFEYWAGIKGFDVWDTFDKKRALVCELSCPDLVKRHQSLMDEHQATYDYPARILQRICHPTLPKSSSVKI